MFSTLLLSIFGLAIQIIGLYKWIVIISAILTWVQPDPNNAIVQTLYKLTNPVYDWMKSKFSTSFNGVDLAPLILIFFLMFVESFLVSLLHG